MVTDPISTFLKSAFSTFAAEMILPVITAFSNKTSIKSGDLKRDSETAHRYLAEEYKDFIRTIDPKEHRKAFGLPRKPDKRTRRASPVFLHVHELGKVYVPVASFFPAVFLPNRPEPPGGYGVINRFLDQLSRGVDQ